jgi:hypothetical protein
MNNYQRLWWEQAQSDHGVFIRFRGEGIAECHSLHYLQMVTEKLAKAYFWRSQTPPKSHVGFVQFLRFLGAVGLDDRERVAKIFSFNRFTDFQNWIYAILPIAYDLERIAPALASDGPNPEYPWPHAQPASAPVSHEFAVWKRLSTGQGRDLMRIIHIAVNRFAEYSDA